MPCAIDFENLAIKLDIELIVKATHIAKSEDIQRRRCASLYDLRST